MLTDSFVSPAASALAVPTSTASTAARRPISAMAGVSTRRLARVQANPAVRRRLDARSLAAARITAYGTPAQGGTRLRRLVAAVAVGMVILAAVLVARALRAPSKQVDVAAAAPVSVDANAAAERLAGALRLRTVSNQDPAQFDGDQFRALHVYLAEHFPRVHQTLQREAINDYSVIYTWKGSGTGKPVLLLAHLDVVPVDPSTESSWIHPPFSGDIADGYVWGRGAIDDKGSALAILEAIELLLAQATSRRGRSCWRSATTRSCSASTAPRRSRRRSRIAASSPSSCSTRAARSSRACSPAWRIRSRRSAWPRRATSRSS
jgi:hypothetical protein